MLKTIHQAAAALREGKTTPIDLVEQCLAQIDAYEENVRAWVLIDRDLARKEADARLAELKAGVRRSELHGIPIGIKDIIDVFDWPTACGSKQWANAIPRYDAEIVRRLRAAGAIFLGKTVTTAYASFDPPPTRNPWNPKHTPGGSSSGSAAAPATLMCLGAIGSQTGGSITRPASYCGVAGCKPTYGLVPLEGIMPLAHSMDHPGPMARCVRDLEILLNVIQNPPPVRDSDEVELPPRLAVVRGLFEDLAEPAMRNAFGVAIETLRKAGAVIEEFVLPADFGDVVRQHRIVMAVEAAQFHRDRLERRPDEYPPNIRKLLDDGIACPASDYANAKSQQQRLSAFMRAAIDDRTIIAPAATGPAPTAETTGNPAFNSPWSFTGLPVVSFPVAFAPNGLPLAIQLAAGEYRELHLFRVAKWCEQAIGFDIGLPPRSRS
ncbi:MAG: amidase [Gemmataceae bacterium]|nr:amidase [Gemmataceae bacterium]